MYRIGEEELDELRLVIESKSLFRAGNPDAGHQQEVVRFESEWAQTIGTDYALCMSGGGTAALICGLVGLGIGPGDEVIVPAYTWMATPLAVAAVGAIPVLCDIDETLAIDPEEVARLCTPQTRAVIPVHMAGRPANLERLCEIAREKNLFVLEDCSQCDGGSYKGKRVGSWGQAGAFSFNDFKILSCGEGGALVTDDRQIYERALIYHDAGTSFRSYAAEVKEPFFLGQQYRANELMGAVLRVQLQRLEGILHDLRKARRRFQDELEDMLNFAPSNDSEGDCGVAAALQFEDEASARNFAQKVNVQGLGAYALIDHDKHVYVNWTPLLEHRVGHHPAMNPFLFSANQGLRSEYSRDSCVPTLDILRRTVFISMNPDWTDAEISESIAVCRAAVTDEAALCVAGKAEAVAQSQQAPD